VCLKIRGSEKHVEATILDPGYQFWTQLADIEVECVYGISWPCCMEMVLEDRA